jgi:hypothetical protein
MSEIENNFDRSLPDTQHHILPIASSLKSRISRAAFLAIAYQDGHLTPEGIAEAFAQYVQAERLFRDALYAAMGSRSGRPVPRLATHATPDPVKAASDAPMGPEEAKAVRDTVERSAAAKAAWAKVEAEFEPEPERPLAPAPAEVAEVAENGGDEGVEDYSPRHYTVPQKKGPAGRHGQSADGEGFTRKGRYIGPDTHEIRGVLHVTAAEFARRAPPMFASTVQFLVGKGEIKAVRVKAINGRKLVPARIYIPVSEVERIIAEGPEVHCNLANRTSQRPKPQA